MAAKKANQVKQVKQPSRPRRSGAPKKYRYVMTVVEQCVYTTAIDSDRKVKLDELKDIAESRRIHGKLSFQAVADADAWVEEAYANGEKVDCSEVLA